MTRQFNLMLMVLLAAVLMSSSAAWSLDRFVDLKDGTMLDTVSSLRWLKNANCYGQQNWDAAMSSAAGLKSPSCGLTDVSIAGDWHLPTIDELRIFTDAGYRYNTLDAAGFSTVQQDYYWSSSSSANCINCAWVVGMHGLEGGGDKGYNGYVWPVRSGQYWSLDSLVIWGAVDFGSVPVGSLISHQFILKNRDTTTQSVTSIVLGGTNPTQFTLDTGGSLPCSTLSPTLAAGASCTVMVSTKTTTIGSKSASLTVTTPAGSSNIPLTATILPLTITYNGNGNSGGSVPTDSSGYPLNATVTVLVNSGTLTKSGYIFNGWNTAADAGGTTYQPGATFTIITPVTLYAKWTAAPLTPPSGLISWWRGEDNGIDTAGGLNGTPSAGMAYAAGKVGQAFSLNGSTASMTVPDNAKLNFGTNEFSIAAWIKTTDTRIWQRLVTKRASTGYWYSLVLNSGTVTFEIAGSGTNVSSTVSVANGMWHHIAVTRDPVTVSPRKYRLYIDGIENVTLADSGLNLDNTAPLEIGKWSTESYSGIYSGLIDEVQMFNRSLASTEIKSIYSAGSAGVAPPPTVTAISPQSGLATGGASVTITGSGLNSASAVMFGTTAASSFTVNSDTQITAVAPAGAAGTVHVTVTTRGGTTATSSADQFTYVRFVDLNDGTMLDTVSSLRWLKNASCYGWQDWYTAMSSAAGLSSPSCGLTDGSITGDWHLPTIDEFRIFTDAGYTNTSLNAAGFSILQGSYYLCWSSTSYAYDTNSAWYASMDRDLMYVLNKDYGRDVWPVRGGQYWTLDSLVVVGIADFGNQTVSSVSLGHQFLLKNVGATTSSVTSIALGGSNADQFTVASGGAKPCDTLAPTLAAGTSCTVIVTAHPTSIGSKSATLTVATASGSKDIPLTASAFYLPTVTAITPNSGSFSGGTTVTINGSNLTGASSVAFSTNAASNVIVTSDSQISAVSPAGTTGQIADITVTTPGGTSAVSSADQFTYKTIAARNMTSSTISSLDDALSAAKPGEEIRTLAISLPGNFILSRNQILNGGYDGDYLNTTAVPTTLNGSLTVTSGASSVESVVVKGKLAVQGGSLRVNGVTVR